MNRASSQYRYLGGGFPVGSVKQILLGLAVTTGVGVLVAVVFFLYAIADFSFDGTQEVISVTGPEAIRAVSDLGVDTDGLTLRRVSVRRIWTRDSSSEWLAANVDAEAAALLSARLHERQADFDEYLREKFVIEGRVRRGVEMPTPDDNVPRPAWFLPHRSEVRVTEHMLWYRHSSSGYGSATYTQFDEDSWILWGLRFSRQHERLWERGEQSPIEEPRTSSPASERDGPPTARLSGRDRRNSAA
ncbi:MAG: hypothetical protein AAF532_16260 [Planctomycetota bacterium]